jgi:hypothetical protein
VLHIDRCPIVLILLDFVRLARGRLNFPTQIEERNIVPVAEPPPALTWPSTQNNGTTGGWTPREDRCLAAIVEVTTPSSSRSASSRAAAVYTWSEIAALVARSVDVACTRTGDSCRNRWNRIKGVYKPTAAEKRRARAMREATSSEIPAPMTGNEDREEKGKKTAKREAVPATATDVKDAPSQTPSSPPTGGDTSHHTIPHSASCTKQHNTTSSLRCPSTQLGVDVCQCLLQEAWGRRQATSE